MLPITLHFLIFRAFSIFTFQGAKYANAEWSSCLTFGEKFLDGHAEEPCDFLQIEGVQNVPSGLPHRKSALRNSRLPCDFIYRHVAFCQKISEFFVHSALSFLPDFACVILHNRDILHLRGEVLINWDAFYIGYFLFVCFPSVKYGVIITPFWEYVNRKYPICEVSPQLCERGTNYVGNF